VTAKAVLTENFVFH